MPVEPCEPPPYRCLWDIQRQNRYQQYCDGKPLPSDPCQDPQECGKDQIEEPLHGQCPGRKIPGTREVGREHRPRLHQERNAERLVKVRMGKIEWRLNEQCDSIDRVKTCKPRNDEGAIRVVCPFVAVGSTEHETRKYEKEGNGQIAVADENVPCQRAGMLSGPIRPNVKSQNIDGGKKAKARQGVGFE